MHARITSLSMCVQCLLKLNVPSLASFASCVQTAGKGALYRPIRRLRIWLGGGLIQIARYLL